MRGDRTGWRLLKAAMLFGAAGLVGEGLTELGRLSQPFLKPASIPGQGKILEHFALQHVLLPVLAVGVCVFPTRVRSTFSSPVWRVYLGSVLVLVTIPELIVSLRSDLFNPYPFRLPGALRRVEMAQVAGRSVNLIQLQHLVFAHFVLMGSLVPVAAAPDVLKGFAGPRTGRHPRSLTPAPQAA